MSSLRSGVGGVGRSMNREDSHVGQVTFQLNFEGTFGHRLETLPAASPAASQAALA